MIWYFLNCLVIGKEPIQGRYLHAGNQPKGGRAWTNKGIVDEQPGWDEIADGDTRAIQIAEGGVGSFAQGERFWGREAQ